jgi:hypothetical protein
VLAAFSFERASEPISQLVHIPIRVTIVPTFLVYMALLARNSTDEANTIHLSHLLVVLRTTRKQNLFRATLAKDILYPSSVTLSNPRPVTFCVYLRQIAIRDVRYFWVRQQASGHCGASALSLGRNRASRFKGRNKTLRNIPKHQDQKNVKIGQTIYESTMEVQPLLSPEVVAELREDLRRDWFITENDEYRLELEHIWSPPNPLHPNHKMLELDSIENPRNKAIKYRTSILGRNT